VRTVPKITVPRMQMDVRMLAVLFLLDAIAPLPAAGKLIFVRVYRGDPLLFTTLGWSNAFRRYDINCLRKIPDRFDLVKAGLSSPQNYV